MITRPLRSRRLYPFLTHLAKPALSTRLCWSTASRRVCLFVYSPPPPTFTHWSVSFTTCRPTHRTAGAAAVVRAAIATSHPWNYRRGTKRVYEDAPLRRC